jgi:hypothetical protein
MNPSPPMTVLLSDRNVGRADFGVNCLFLSWVSDSIHTRLAAQSPRHCLGEEPVVWLFTANRIVLHQPLQRTPEPFSKRNRRSIYPEFRIYFCFA